MEALTMRAVVLLSGGQDSTTCLYWALKAYDSVHAITIDYGQRHRTEIDAARRIAGVANVPHEVLNVAALRQLGGNALVDTGEPIVATDRLPSTFVPMRNALFITLAAARAYLLGNADVVIGACETDYSGYPDCRRGFIDAMETALSAAADSRVKVVTPLMNKTKRETVQLAREMPRCWDALALSVTCYHGQVPGCGTCPACILRAQGFKDAGENDPAEVRL